MFIQKRKYIQIFQKKNNNLNSQNIKQNTANCKNTNTTSKDKNYYLDSLVHTSSNSNNFNEELNSIGYGHTSTINYINTKKDLILEELYKKKNIILPFKKEINNINININGYNIHSGSLTSRTSNNASKKKSKKNNNIKEIHFYNNDNKNRNKNLKNNNLISKKEGNPVRIKKIYDSIKNYSLNTNKSLGTRTKKKK